MVRRVQRRNRSHRVEAINQEPPAEEQEMRVRASRPSRKTSHSALLADRTVLRPVRHTPDDRRIVHPEFPLC